MSASATRTCPVCGRVLDKDDGLYRCPNCGMACAAVTLERYRPVYRHSSYGLSAVEAVEARRALYDAMYVEHASPEECVGLACELDELVTHDYFAGFAMTVNEMDDSLTNDFLNSRTAEENMDVFGPATLSYMLTMLTPATLASVAVYMERAFPEGSPGYEQYGKEFAEAAERIVPDLYDPSMKRDVYISYSDRDAVEAAKLCRYLEREEITCFMSARNIRRRIGAEERETAEENCGLFVFVSSENSRRDGDRAYGELSRIMEREHEASPDAPRGGMPPQGPRRRVEYLVGEHGGHGDVTSFAEGRVRAFFRGQESAERPWDVAVRVWKGD